MDKANYNPKPYTSDEIDEIISRTDQKLFEFIKSGKYKDVLLMMGNLNKYSFLNQMYIILQKPDAVSVFGLKGWNLQGRSVITGEKAIKIMAPIIETKLEERQNKVGESILDEEGNPLQDKIENVVGYRPVYVFDLSQTKGKDIEAFKIDKDTAVAFKDKIMRSLKDCVSERGYFLAFVHAEKLPKGCDGICDTLKKEIWIKDGMSDLETISVSIHECGHALAHTAYRSDFQGLTTKDVRQIREVEAESISLVVASRFGLDTENYSLSYIAGWSEADITKFRKNIDVIRSASTKLIDAIEKSFEKEKSKDMVKTDPEIVKKKSSQTKRKQDKSAEKNGMAM